MTMTNITNLRKVIDNGVSLDEDAIDSVVEAISYRCHSKTKKRLTSILRYDLSHIDTFGILERVQYCDEYGWQYVAGQDHTAECKVVRDIILGK